MFIKIKNNIGLLLIVGLITSGCISVKEQKASILPKANISPKITNQDFARADKFLFSIGTVPNEVLNADISYRWLDNGKELFYKFQEPSKTQYLKVNSATGQKTTLFDHEKMAKAISGVLKEEISADALPIDHLSRIDNNNYVVNVRNKNLDCDLVAIQCDTIPTPEATDPTSNVSPDGNYTLFSRDYNLWLKENSTGEESAITSNGQRNWAYGKSPESSTSEITKRRYGVRLPVGALWSPKGKKFISYQLDERHLSELALVQALPEDGSFRPKLHTYLYDLVGDKPSLAKLFIYDVEQNTRIELNYSALPSTLSVPLIRDYIKWSKDGKQIYLLDAQMDNQLMKLIRVNPNSGKTQTLIEEKGNGVVLPNAQLSNPPNVRILDNGDIIWYSERSGWGHLYLYDGKTGELKNAITSGEWLVRDIIFVDEKSREIWVSGSGREKVEDIYFRKLYRAHLDGSKIELLTKEKGDHNLWPDLNPKLAAMMGIPPSLLKPPIVSSSGDYFVDLVTYPDKEGNWKLRNRNGEQVVELASVDYSLLPPFEKPETFTVRSADNQYDLHGVLLKPINFDPKKKYPIIEYIYPGPQAAVVPKTLGGGFSIFGGNALGLNQSLAQLGFVVYMIDGRGTTFRSKNFLDYSYGRLETAGTLEDHVHGLKTLAKNRPWLDLERVGIYGSSGGGFATGHALLDFPDFYKVGVSSAGNHDLRSYIRLWGETYHGKPNEVDYEKVFSGNNAKNLKGKLLLAHGDMDDNVHPANTTRLVDALIKANKQFDMLIMPNVAHGILVEPYFQRITQNYFLKHLMGADLPSEVNLNLPGTIDKP
jgi:dipeptidyl aminopeptidase/acylaminoacyl peptidase